MLKTLLRIDADVAVAIRRPRLRDPHLLVPAVHSAHRIGVDREGEVLVHAHLAPPYALRVGVVALEGLDAVDLAHGVFPITLLIEANDGGGDPGRALVFAQTPAAQVMRHGDDAGFQALRHPASRDEMAYLGLDFRQVARLDP